MLTQITVTARETMEWCVMQQDRGGALSRDKPKGRFGNWPAPVDDFWPEVSNCDPGEHGVKTDPDNSPARVLFEAFLALTVAGLIAIAAITWVPIPS